MSSLADYDDLRLVQEPCEAAELGADALEVVVDELVGVALEAGLRPAALVVSPRLLVEVVGEILETAGAEAVETALLAADDEHESALAAADERDERRQVEKPADLDLVRHHLGQRQGPPHVVEAGAEDGQTMSTVSLELGLDVAANALEILPQCESLLVRELPRPPTVLLGRLVQKGVEARLGVAGRRNRTRIEVEVDADRKPVLSLEACEVAKLVPGDSSCHPVAP